MEKFQIEILNPKAKKLLEDMADLNLITISKSFNSKEEFKRILSKLRSQTDILSLDEITKEVESVRSSRHANKAK